jgi:Membrane protein involved in the export of O-antigen and teichoic acid
VDAKQPSLRTQAVRGSIYLTLRQGTSVLLGVVGLLFMTRIVGPEGYGIYVAAFGIFQYLTLLAEGGVKMYLLRTKTDTPIEVFHLSFYWLLFASLVGTVIATATLGGRALLHSQDSMLAWTLLALCLNLPFYDGDASASDAAGACIRLSRYCHDRMHLSTLLRGGDRTCSG